MKTIKYTPILILGITLLGCSKPAAITTQYVSGTDFDLTVCTVQTTELKDITYPNQGTSGDTEKAFYEYFNDGILSTTYHPLNSINSIDTLMSYVHAFTPYILFEHLYDDKLTFDIKIDGKIKGVANTNDTKATFFSDTDQLYSGIYFIENYKDQKERDHTTSVEFTMANIDTKSNIVEIYTNVHKTLKIGTMIQHHYATYKLRANYSVKK